MAPRDCKKRKLLKPKGEGKQNATSAEKKAKEVTEDSAEVKFLVPEVPSPLKPTTKPRSMGSVKKHVKKSDSKASNKKYTNKEISKKEFDTVLHYFALNPIFDKI